MCGRGIEPNLEEGMKYHKFCADQGDAEGQVNYEHSLEEGIGIEGLNLRQMSRKR
jgi:hypothetical protein